MNMFEINHSLLRQFGPENWTIYKGKHMLCFVDNHDVSRIASALTNPMHLPLAYAICFGMPGIPCIYYGSEWGTKGDKKDGDPGLRISFTKPIENELSNFISVLSRIKKQSHALNYGDFTSKVLTNRQCVFSRKSEKEHILVGINADASDFRTRIQVESEVGTDLLTGKKVSFHEDIVMEAYTAYFWKIGHE